MNRKFKKLLMGCLSVVVVILLAGCGGAAVTAADSTDGGSRVISGTLTTTEAASVSKSIDTEADAWTETAGCIGEVCSVQAVNSDGEHVEGELDGSTNQWRASLTAGTWAVVFFNNQGEVLGYLSLNDSTSFTVEAGDDLDLGETQLGNGVVVVVGEIGELHRHGLREASGNDCDFDGLIDGVDDDTCQVDTSVFQVVKVRPFDGQVAVAPCRPVKIKLTQAIDPASLTSEAVVITDSEGNPVEGTLSYEAELEEDHVEYEIKFEPAGGFEMGNEVVVSLPATAEGGILNESAEPLAAPFESRFTVRDFGGSSESCHEMDMNDEEYDKSTDDGGGEDVENEEGEEGEEGDDDSGQGEVEDEGHDDGDDEFDNDDEGDEEDEGVEDNA